MGLSRARRAVINEIGARCGRRRSAAIFLLLRHPYLPPIFQNAHARRAFCNGGFLQGGHAFAGAAARVCGQKRGLENVHDHRFLPVLIMKGDFPSECFAFGLFDS